jgi:hypothetical protein
VTNRHDWVLVFLLFPALIQLQCSSQGEAGRVLALPPACRHVTHTHTYTCSYTLTYDPPPSLTPVPVVSSGGGGGGGGGIGGGGATPAPIRPPGPPAQGWLADMENFQHIQAPSPGPSAAAAASRPAAAGNSVGSSSPAPSAAAAAGSSAAAAAAAAAGFKVPSAEEIQWAYDAAQGPPPKPHLAGGSGAAPVSEGQGRMAPPPAGEQ